MDETQRLIEEIQYFIEDFQKEYPEIMHKLQSILDDFEYQKNEGKF